MSSWHSFVHHADRTHNAHSNSSISKKGIYVVLAYDIRSFHVSRIVIILFCLLLITLYFVKLFVLKVLFIYLILHENLILHADSLMHIADWYATFADMLNVSMSTYSTIF